MDISLSDNRKKRKSIAHTNNKSPKIAKSEDELQVKFLESNTPILSTNNDVGSRGKDSKKKKKHMASTLQGQKQNKSPKENKTTQFKNGESSKILQKFQGVNTVKANQQIKKSDEEKALSKRDQLVQKLNERSQTEGKDVVVKSLNEKIDAILSRTEITKTAKRKLKNYKQLINLISGDGVNTAANQSNQDRTGKNQKQIKKIPQNNQATVKAKNKNLEKQLKQDKLVIPKTESDEEESGDSDFVVQENIKIGKKQKKEFSAKKNIDDEKHDSEESNESDDVEDESEEKNDSAEDSDDVEEESADEEVKAELGEKLKQVIKIKGKDKPQSKKIETLNPKSFGENKSRYILFIGNIAYDTTKKELEQHFERVGKVTDVRIPTDQESNRPRGFAYVEFADEAAYQKALDLNGSQLKNRQIKVEYTQGGNKKSENRKNEIKAKNFKLHTMRKQGKFGGGSKIPNRGGFKGRGRN